jgi:DNA polymerase I-like protein with 3'-5' exonuclease and polymerase domains
MPKEKLIDIESYIDVDSMVKEFVAQNIVIDSTNDDYIREAMIAMATAAENYYRWGILDTIEKLKNLRR